MENLKKNPLSLHLNVDDFVPASSEEKQSLVIMRDSVSFWKDGLRRLRKNKIAMVSLLIIILIAIFAYVLPAVWPYGYDEQIKYSENLAPFEYGKKELERIAAGESVITHILGTDGYGRDIFVRIIFGARSSLTIAFATIAISCVAGLIFGVGAGYFGGVKSTTTLITTEMHSSTMPISFLVRPPFRLRS